MKTITVVKRKSRINSKVIYSLLLSLLIFFILIAMVAQPEKYTQVAFNSIIVWATILLPTLFPFMLYTKFLSGLGLIEPISRLLSPITSKLYNTSGISGYVYLMSIMSGYPVGAKITTDLYMDGRISRGEASRIISFCANCGPMFIVGTVGAGLLINAYAGYIMLFSHFLGAFLNGLIFRKYKLNDLHKMQQKTNHTTEQDFLSSSVISSTNSMFIVGAFVVVFFILIEFLNQTLHINNQSIFGAIFNGFLEITHGCKDIANLVLPMSIKTILCCFLASFGGLSTAMQSITFLKRAEIKFSYFLLLKFTHAIISTIICSILALLIL